MKISRCCVTHGWLASGVVRWLGVAFVFGMCRSPACAADKPSVSVREAIPYTEAAGKSLLLDAYVPDTDGDRPAVIVVHGGAWRMGDRKQLAAYAQALASRGCVCFAIDYRLAPEHKFPAQIEDCRSAVKWVRRHAGEYHVDPHRLGAIGYSAGGHLVALLATTGEDADPQTDDAVDTRLQAVAAGGAPTEFREMENDGAWAEYWLGGTLKTAPEQFTAASPAAFIDADDAPTFFFHGTRDQLVPPAWSAAMHDKLKEKGVKTEMHLVEGANHLTAAINQKALEAACTFLLKELESPSSSPVAPLSD
ncbi:MAG: alpha/beta hydrolase [Planctomycetales bacterium]|nr:alpha/beta hydrolase [Planctomycetales bacterium]